MTSDRLYGIAAGYNVAAISIPAFTSIIPSGDRAFYPPKGQGLYAPGLRRDLPNGDDYWSGYPFQDWLWDALTRKQFEYLQSTYCGGGYAGKVTVMTRPGTDAYARYNAWLKLKTLPESDSLFFANRRYTARLTRMVLAA